ncbi:MAG: hypothetical protein K0B11_16030 [Mariniphaga sp.]|nr:hypothetical protein [Mariniphaga sp.]
MRKICILFLIIVFPTFSFAQNDEVTWDYPVKPGSEEWKALKNQKEKLEVCQIPEDILQDIPTNKLMELCFNYPLIYDILAFNSTQTGMNEFRRNFNGLNEFVQREDASDLLIRRYSDVQPRGYDKNWTNIQKGYYSLEIIAIELFLSQNEIIDKMTLSQKQDLVRELLKKLEEKEDKELYGKTSQMSIGFALSRILQNSGFQWNQIYAETKTEIERFIEYGNFRDVKILPYIVSSSKEFLKH